MVKFQSLETYSISGNNLREAFNVELLPESCPYIASESSGEDGRVRRSTCIYTSVTLMLLCPRKSRSTRIFFLDPNRCVAQECHVTCVVTGRPIPARAAAYFTTSFRLRSPQGSPGRRLSNRYVVDRHCRQCSRKTSMKIAGTANSRARLPLPPPTRSTLRSPSRSAGRRATTSPGRSPRG